MIYDIDGNELSAASKTYIGMSEPISVPDGWTANAYVRVGGNSGGAVGTISTNTSALKASDFIDCYGAEMVIVRLPRTSETSPVGVGMCFYDDSKNALPNAWNHYFYNRTTAYSDFVKAYVPKNAHYFRTTYWNDSYVAANCPNEPFYYRIGQIPEGDEYVTHEIPCSTVMTNVVRRARQLTDIVWQPRVDIPRFCLMNGSAINFLDWFKAGQWYKGIPYSGSGEPDSWYGTINPNTDSGKWGYFKFYVGQAVDFETFITATRFPNSIFSERTGRTTPNYDSSIYGIVCNGLTNYCLGMGMPVLKIVDYGSSPKMYEVASTVSEDNVQNTRLCDVLWHSGHVMLITDIKRAENGTITDIEISEATTVGIGTNSIPVGESKLGGICRRKFYTLDEYLTRCVGNYKVYRWKAFVDIGYTKSDYVDTGNEGDYEKIVDLPCIPYMGNKFRYKVGYIVNTKICIGATGFTTLVVMKDGAEFNRFTINGATEIETGFSAVGSYSAYLLDSNNKRTMSCTWTVENP